MPRLQVTEHNFQRLTSRYQEAAQDLAYAAARCRNLMGADGRPPFHTYKRFQDWLDMVVESHRRMCELLGVDTKRFRTEFRDFPLTEQQVHEAYMTDPEVRALADIFTRIREACVEVNDVQLAALAVYVLAHAGKVPGHGLPEALARTLLPTNEDIKKLLKQLEL